MNDHILNVYLNIKHIHSIHHEQLSEYVYREAVG